MKNPIKPLPSKRKDASDFIHGQPLREIHMQLPANGAEYKVNGNAERTGQGPDSDRIDGVTGVILAGGASSRMGANKALLEIDGTPLIEHIHRKLARIFRDVVIITNTPEDYAFLSCRTAPD